MRHYELIPSRPLGATVVKLLIEQIYLKGVIAVSGSGLMF